MKLTEIKELPHAEVDLKEGVIPVHITMILDQVVRAGKVTNNVQSFVIAGLVDMFKNGGPTRWPRDLNAYGVSTMGTSSDMIQAIRSLAAEEQVGVATWLLTELQNVANFESNPYCNKPQLDPVEWMRWVLRKQD